MTEVVLDVWPMNNNDSPEEVFPELKEKVVTLAPDSFGIAVSGGGSRSCALTCGYFKALLEMNILDEAAYISAVSGGSWASSIYVYSPHDEDKILGTDERQYSIESEHSKKFTKELVSNLKLGRIASVVTSFTKSAKDWLGIFSGANNKAWTKFIADSLLKQHQMTGKMFVMSKDHAEKIEKVNEANNFVQEKNMVIPRGKKPFLIINGVVEGPQGYTSGWGASLQMTPMYTGVPFYANNSYSYHYASSKDVTKIIREVTPVLTPKVDVMKIVLKDMENSVNDMKPFYPGKGDSRKKLIKLVTGGGVVSSYAFGIKKLINDEDQCGAVQTTGVLPKGRTPFLLQDAVAISSMASAAAMQNFRVGGSYIPKFAYLPVLTKDGKNDKFKQGTFKHDQGGTFRCLGDGGNLENTGILPLIQRGIRKVIALINTMEPISKVKNSEEMTADSQLLCLFGNKLSITSEANNAFNQIFKSEDCQVVLEALRKSKEEGKRGAVSFHRLKLVENTFWHIKAKEDETVDILFVYNERATEFYQHLPPGTRKDIGEKFPHTSTMGTSSTNLFSVSKPKAAMLAAHSYFVLRSNQAKLEKLLGKEVDPEKAPK